MNIVRITILITVLLENKAAFEFWHAALGAMLSIAYVILMWIGMCVIFRIKKVPFVSDFSLLLEEAFKK